MRLALYPVTLAIVLGAALPSFAATSAKVEDVKITPAQAAQAAKGQNKGAIREIRLNLDAKTPEYCVVFEDRSMTCVDATNGKVFATSNSKHRRNRHNEEREERDGRGGERNDD